MTRTSEMMTQMLKSNKHPFKGTPSRTKKGEQHRYERRRVREFLREAEWSEMEP